VNDVMAAEAGTYALQVDYVLSGSRTFLLSVNDGPGIELPLTGQTWAHSSTATVNVRLEAGKNKIKVYNDSAYAPDLDRLVVAAR
jgi:alpha-galactosidase